MDANIKQSNPIIDSVVNRIQNSLSRLQSTINSNKIVGNDNNNNNNIRKNLLDSKDYNIKESNILLTETSTHGQIPIGYSMFNNNSIINTDERNDKTKSNYEYIIKNNIIHNKPNANQLRKTNLKKRNYFIDNNIKNNSVNKWKCYNCGNINLLENKICINCGKSKSHIKNMKNDNFRFDKSDDNNIINFTETSYKIDKDINNSNENSKSEISNEEDLRPNYNNIRYTQNEKKVLINPNIEYNKPNRRGLFNPFTKSEANIIDPSYINNFNVTEIIYSSNRNKKEKKINDLYLYGDYLESELKESNDENIQLLEKYKDIKNEIHNLNQINTKIKQKIEELQKKDLELKKLNSQLKNGFSLFQKKYDGNINNFEIDNTDNINILKQLELTNKNNIEIKNNYEKEIENIKQKILLLTEEEEENDDKEKELEKNIEKEKKEIEENNDKYIFLLKENELLNQDIEKLQKKIDVIKTNENEEKNLDDPVKKIAILKNNIKLFDKEINENKIIIKDLINEYKNLSENNKANLNNDNDNNYDNQGDDNKNEYLLFKEKNNKLSNELLKLKDITQNLTESKDKIISIYEGEIAKLNNFYLKAKEKTMNIIEKENNMNEIEEKNLMKIHEENENIKNENYELIKDLDQLTQLQLIYQGLLEENKKLKNDLYGNEFTVEKQDLLTDNNNDEEII